MKFLIVIPTYNEAENLPLIVSSVLNKTPESVHVLIVDDGSPDGTGKIAKKLASENNRIHDLHRAGKLGLGTAYIAGFKWGLEQGFDAFIEMDADFSHRPEYLPQMLKYLQEYDFVIGSRYVSGGGTKNWGLIRKILSRGGSIYARLVLSAPVRDFTGGFNGWKRSVLEKINLDTIRSDGYSFQIELKYRAFLCGFKFFEFPIIFEDRQVGISKMSSNIVFEALLRVLFLKFNKNTQKVKAIEQL